MGNLSLERAERAPGEPMLPTPLHQDELLGRLSHELRSPLAAIKGYAATLRRHERRLSVAERRECLLAIENATTQLNTIIERMLLFSQIEAGAITPIRTAIDLAALTREAVANAQAELATQRSGEAPTLRMALAPNSHGRGGTGGSALLVNGDPRLLRVVLDELIENAIKFTPAGGVIELAARAVDSEQGRMPRGGPGAVEVAVRNTGAAIPTEHLSRIFDHFHQADSGLTREVGGLGLGLTLCQRIVALHGGEVFAQTGPGGNVFTLCLPWLADAR